MTFCGTKIKNLRKLRGMTQGELAEKVGVTQSFISDLEYNKKFPGMPTLIKLAEVLGVTVSDLFEG